MIARIHKALDEKEQGFTLIELLVVIIIIGILAAIAIPAFLNQRENAWRSQAESDLKNAAIAAESYAVAHNGSYTGLVATTGAGDIGLEDNGYNKTASITMSITVAADGKSFTLTADHSSLAENYAYSSTTGVISKVTT